jgi:threonine dehydrogenase-like Zn-dependent dehydrogenase
LILRATKSIPDRLLGTILSESFDVTGTGTGTTPEPGSVMLFGSGVVGLLAVLRRKLF